MESTKTLSIADETANPAPLGLCGFGLTTLLLNLHNAGIPGMEHFDTMIMAMGLFFGGLAQAVVGKMEWKKNNMFGMVAFSSYGFFWIILVALLMLPKLGLGEAPSAISMGWFLLVWGVFSLGLWIATFAHGLFMQILFFTVVLLFMLLAIADFLKGAGSSMAGTVKMLGGIDGIICGSLALYIALATVVNDSHKRQVLPLK